ncbi:uncharacterized protein PHALS_14260 [Plasmopara halstedii]|uniref:Uncharacterized protein n=1 Tax=Plasmopara halstedii TaxID=4781 RepID=A0A0P1ARC8_PLAHL|nr:uncharacterized protein PHALS_14260 [Plasmopara halstedii]CEG43986.1 hypothetical protein PHALS_14260 [Plasmopara halstedii]|eukprot:XP_024580355.1 hypothetical protein PHALS_14260 [Plasmopara halstedii]
MPDDRKFSLSFGQELLINAFKFSLTSVLTLALPGLIQSGSIAANLQEIPSRHAVTKLACKVRANSYED